MREDDTGAKLATLRQICKEAGSTAKVNVAEQISCHAWLQGNLELVERLCREKETIGIGRLGHFFNVSPVWRCPVCRRSKTEIARRDKHGRLLCRLTVHHDHFFEHAIAALNKAMWLSARRMGADEIEALARSFVRFQASEICEDCNLAERFARKPCGVPAEFSFAPYEIAQFITPALGKYTPPEAERAKAVYEIAKPVLELMKANLRAYITDALPPVPSPYLDVVSDNPLHPANLYLRLEHAPAS